MKQLTFLSLSGKGCLRYGIIGIVMLLLWTVSNEAWAQTTGGSQCFIGTNNPAQVSARSTWTINPTAGTVTIRTTLAKTFVDNTYGINAIGWPGGHSFSNLTGSDQLQLALYDASNVKKLEFKMDYISSSSAAPSGYKSLGVTGGDGNMIFGSASNVQNVVTSMDANFNQFGYILTSNSPATNSTYTPNPSYPNWIFDVWYECTISLSAFGTAGFGNVQITGVHASPSKTGNNTEPVTPLTSCCALFTPSLSGNNTVCDGQTTTLTATGGGTYLWSTGATTAAITVSPTSTTTYTVTVTSTDGCTATLNRTVNISCVTYNGSQCFIGTNNPAQVSAQSVWTINPNNTVTIRTTLAKTFVDNTYGINAIGWPGGHSFSNLTGSDQLQLALYDASNVKKLEFKMDYISSSSAAPSGYKSLGVTGGDGNMIFGSASNVQNVVTSMDANFNQFGYVLTSNSPATNSTYAPNPSYPDWIFDVWYEVTVSLSAFGTAGFGYPTITGVHASPSKTGNNTEPVTPTCCTLPAPPISGTASINCGQSVTLTASGGGTYLWSTGATTAAITVSPTTTTTYSVTVTSTNGCTSTTNKIITVGPCVNCGDITGGQINGNQTICPGGDPTTLTSITPATTTYSGGVKYQWYCFVGASAPANISSATIITGATAATYDPPAGSVTAKKWFIRLAAPNDPTCTTYSGQSNWVSVDVGTIPSTPNGATTGSNVCPATTVNLATLQPASPSTPGGTFEWRTGSSPTSPLVSNPAAVGAGPYYLFEKSAAGCYSSPKMVTITINPCPVPTLTINDITVNESAGVATLQICASATSTLPITVTYNTSNGTALSVVDYTSTTGTALIPAGQTCVNITIPITDDFVSEPTETFNVNLTSPNNATIADPLGIVTILDNDNPTPSLTINDVTVNEDAGTATLQICASAAATSTITVQYTTANATALAGSDYTTTSATATIPVGQTCVNVTFPIIDDNVLEPTETFNVNLANPNNATIADPQGVVTILDNDTTPPALTINDITVNESAGTATLQICASYAPGSPVTVQYTTANATALAGLDYTATSATATIPAGQTCVNVSFPIINDTNPEPTETFNVNLTNPTNATIADPQGVVTILDNDTPPCLVSIEITGKACNNNGTPSNPNDDTYTFVLTVFGAGTGSTWQGSFNNVALGVYQFGPTPYNTPVPMGPFPAGPFTGGPSVPPLYFPNGLDITINVYDSANQSCAANTVVTSTGPCSNVVPSLTINDVTVNENAGTATLQICTSAVSGSPITVTYTTANATAIAGLDYTATTATATIPAGQTCVNVSFPIINDSNPEPTETFNVNLTNPTNANIADPQGVVTILDNDTPPPSLTINDVTVNENAGTATLQICASAASTSPITVVYTTSNATAQAGLDYTATNQTATIPAGQTCVNVSFPIIDDSNPEPTETFNVNLTNPTNATIADPQGVVTILDNDTPPPSLTINDVTVNESAGTATLQICASAASTSPITVVYTTSNATAIAGLDYTATSATATIPAGQTCTNVSFPIINDSNPEPTETFNVNLTNPTNATIADPQGVVTILDNDTPPPSLTINDITVNENAGTATLQICASAASTSPISVVYTTANGSAQSGIDYTAISTTATIPAGQTCVNVTFPIIDDLVAEPTENFTVNLTNPTNASIADPQGVVTILDNDSPTPTLVINDVTVNENAGTATLQICASAASFLPVTVVYTTANASALSGIDYTAISSTATIPAGQTCVNVTFPIIDDLVAEPTENFNVNLTNPTNATIADPQGVVTILDNDSPPPSLTINDITVNENAGTATLQICASAASISPITVIYTTANASALSGIDYTAISTTATIPAGQTCANVTFSILDDLVAEPTENFNVNLSNPTNASIADPQGVVTILDNDTPPPSLTINDVTVNENAGTATLQICASAASISPITVQYTTSNGSALAGSDYTATSSMATIPAGQTCVNVSFPIINDLVAEPTETFNVNLTNPTNASIADPQGVVTILDNDTPPPSLTINDVTVNESAGTATLQICASAASTSPISVIYTTANGSAQSGLDYTAISATATIPAGQTCTNVSFPIINDLVAEPTETFTVNLTNPTNATIADPQGVVTILDNDTPPPSLTINDVTVNESAGTATLQICASAAGTSAITVQYTTSNGSALAGSDYTAVLATATIPAGQTCVNVSIPIVNDLVAEPTETFTVNLTNPTNATIADPQGVVTILDNDTPPPSLTINDVTVNENAGTATLQICASAAGTSAITVQYTTSNGSALAGSDYTAVLATATIPAGQTCVNVSIPIVNDLVAEPTETFNVNLTNPTNATIADPQGVVTIIDNDTPVCDNITYAGAIGYDESGVSPFDPSNIVQTAAPSGGSGALEYKWQQSTNGTTWADISGATGMTYDPGVITQTTQYRRCVRRTNCTIWLNTNVVIKTVTTSTLPKLNVNDVSVLENAGPAVLQVCASETSSLAITFTYTTVNASALAGSDYTATTATATIPAGQTCVNITVPIIDDSVVEPNETFLVNLSSPVNATIQDGQGVVTIIDNDGTGACDNVTNPGSVGYYQSGCGPYDPALIVETAAPSGGSGSLEYIWQSSPNNWTWTNISGATSASYDPASISASTFYRRGVRRMGCTAYQFSGSVLKEVTGPCGTTCDNVTYGGNIGYAESGASPFDPAQMVETAAPSGGSGALQYQWQQSTNGTTWTDISGATGTSYDPGVITTTTHYRRAVRRANCTAWLFSNVVIKTVVPSVDCNDVTGGSVGSSQTICNGGDPAPINSLSPATTSYAGGVKYVWMCYVGANPPTSMSMATMIPGATGAGYDPPAGSVTAKKWFRRCAGVNDASCTTYPAESEWVYVDVTSCTVNCNDIAGGSIGYNQTICTSGDPVAFTSIAPATTSFAGGVKYQWFRYEGATAPATMSLASPIAGATGATYDAPAGSVATKTWFRRCAAPNDASCNFYYGETSWIFVEVTNCGGTCSNVTDPGQVGYYEAKCAPFDPEAIVETMPVAGGNGALEYMWQSSTDNWTWTTISGATGASYDPPVIYASTYYRRGVRRAGCTDYMFSNSVYKRNTCQGKMGEEMTQDAISELKVMPVPTSSVLTVQFEAFTEQPGSVMQIFDVTGRLVMQQNLFIQIGFNNLSVDVSSLNSGYYFVEVTGNAVRQRAKFIIAR